ncbi:MAG: cytidylyltransferase domain-containing protein [Rhodospirillales bacterium]
MIGERRVLAIVPARGGSVGVPLKNIRPIAGRPLIEWTGVVLADLPEIDRAVVSTDHEEIAHIAETAGIAAPFRRPEALSGPRIGDFEVLLHALETCEQIDQTRYHVILMLQPTSVLRRAEHVREAIEKLVAEDLDSVWSVSPVDLKYHPLKQLQLRDGRLSLVDAGGQSVIARQQLTPTYFRNGAVYAFSRECLLDQRTIYGHRMGAVIIEEPMVSIDTLDDFTVAEKELLKRTEHNGR